MRDSIRHNTDPEDVAALDPIRSTKGLEYCQDEELWETFGRDRKAAK